MSANKKLISVRLNPEYLEEMDKLVESYSYNYATRSDLIEAGVKLALVAAKYGLLKDAFRFYPRFGDVVDEFTFKYHRQHR